MRCVYILTFYMDPRGYMYKYSLYLSSLAHTLVLLLFVPFAGTIY